MFAVGPSNIVAAGEGLFAVVDVPAGTRIPYEGITKQTASLTPEEIEIALDVGKGLSIVGTGIAAKINDGLDVHPANCKWVVKGEGMFAKAFVEAAVDIPSSEELYIAYGDSYWKHFHARRAT